MAPGAAHENNQKQHAWNKPPFPDEGTAHLQGSVTKFENTLKRDCFTSTIFRYQPCQNPRNLQKPDQSMKGLDFETKFLSSLCETWMSMFDI